MDFENFKVDRKSDSDTDLGKDTGHALDLLNLYNSDQTSSAQNEVTETITDPNLLETIQLPSKSNIETLKPHIVTRTKRRKFRPVPATWFDQHFGQHSWSRFLVLQTDGKVSATKLENKLLTECPSKDMTFRPINDKEWLIETTTKEQSETYLSMDKIGNTEIQITKHDKLNSIVGTVILSNEENNEDITNHILLDSLQMRYGNVQDVEIYEIPSRKDNVTKVKIAKIKFEGRDLPSNIKLQGTIKEVREYIPKPLQCTVCSRFGHSEKKCKNDPICAFCSSSEHPTKWNCGTAKCVNCGEDHHSRSKTCIFYLYNTELKLLQSRTGMSIKEAKLELKVRGFLDPAKNPAYKQVTKNNTHVTPLNNSLAMTNQISTSNSFDILANLDNIENVDSTNTEKQEGTAKEILTVTKLDSTIVTTDDNTPLENIDQSHADSQTGKVKESNAECKKRLLENATPPKKKKANITPEQCHQKDTPNTKRVEQFPPTLSINETMESKQPEITSHESSEHIATTKDKSHPSSEETLPIQDEISPSPVIGATGKAKVFIRGNSLEKTSHKSSCGCHDCFLTQFQELKNITVHKVVNLVDNFIKNKNKNQLGSLEHHIAGCMCVDHLLKKKASGSLHLDKFIEKQKHIPAKTGVDPKEQRSGMNKISRNNPLTRRHQPLTP